MKLHQMLLCGILMLLPLWATAQIDSTYGRPAAAPVGDSTTWDSSVQATQPAVLHSQYGTLREVNLQNNPDYYDYEDNAYYQRSRRPYGHLGHNYCNWFLEGEGLYGPHDLAYGFNLAYVPNRFGVYASLMGGINADWLTVGAVCRVSEPQQRLDWQLYGGIVVGYGYGAEAGIRLATNADRNYGKFCWNSISAGVLNAGGVFYGTFGVSLEWVGLTTLLLLL